MLFNEINENVSHQKYYDYNQIMAYGYYELRNTHNVHNRMISNVMYLDVLRPSSSLVSG